MRFSVSFIIVFCTLVLVACRPSGMQQMPEEAALESVLQKNPDSLANILEEEINPHLLSDAQKADYARWLAKAHIRQGRSLMNDTLIHYSVEYYKKTDSEHLLEAHLLAAEQADWKKDDTSQKEHILHEALYVAQARNDTATIQSIIFSLSSLLEIPEDIKKINELIQITKSYGGEEWNVFTYLNLTKLYSLSGQVDSALFYTGEGIALTKKLNDPLEFDLIRSYVNRLNALGQSKNALEIMKEFENRIPVGNDLNFYYILTWINMGKLDSAQVYIDSFHSQLNNYKNTERYADIVDEIRVFELTLGLFQSISDAKKGQSLSIDNIGTSINSILDDSRNKIKIDREQQFVQNKLVRDNLNLDIERAVLKQRFLWAGVGMLLVIVLIVFFYQRKLLKKERSVHQIKEQLRLHSMQLTENESLISKNEEIICDLSLQIDEGEELKQEISLLVKENEKLKQKNISLQNDIEQYSKSIGKNNSEMATYEKLVENNAKLQERERFLTTQLVASTPLLDKLSKKPRYIDVTEWPEIIHAVNLLFDGFSYRLSHDFPGLTEEDVQYCCLIKLRLSSSVIATLTGISPSSVTKRKLRIKEKMIQQRPSEVRKEQPVEIYLWKYS